MCRRYRRWVETGLLNAQLETPADLAVRDQSADMIDSTVVRAHYCAAAIKKELSRSARLAYLGGSNGPAGQSIGTDRWVVNNLPRAIAQPYVCVCAIKFCGFNPRAADRSACKLVSASMRRSSGNPFGVGHAPSSRSSLASPRKGPQQHSSFTPNLSGR